jgi:hypothetical protein
MKQCRSTTSNVPRRGWARLVGLVAAMTLAIPFTPAALAAPTCIDSDNPCEPNKLCTFKAQLAEKVFLYQTLLRNSQVTKNRFKGRREGIRYDGKLYDAAWSEARRDFPDDSKAEQAVKAGQIFNQKLREYVGKNFVIPKCSGTAMLDRSLLPKAGYGGMTTDENCRVWVNYEGGEYDPGGFGANDKTSCQEFYDRDRAHEIIHQRNCEAAKKSGKDQHAIDALIEEEITAYAHSVRLSLAYVRVLSIECSAEPNPDDQKARAKRVEDLLGPYLNKGK